MTEALLLYNPISGSRQDDRADVVASVADALRTHGYRLRVEATMAAGSAAGQVQRAVAGGVTVVFACGGDGTMHEVLQALAGTDTLLAPIPMGRGNALCRELGMPLEAVRAAEAYGCATPEEVSVGECIAERGRRYFLLLAGAGPDGALIYRMLTTPRGRTGRWAYALHALGLLLRNRFREFTVRYQTADGAWHIESVVSAMALRVGTLGGVFPGIGRGASVRARSMRLVLARRPAWLSLPLWFVSSWLRVERWNMTLVQADAIAFTCEGEGIHAQVDGEWVGRLPVAASLGRLRVRLLVPSRRGSSG